MVRIGLPLSRLAIGLATAGMLLACNQSSPVATPTPFPLTAFEVLSKTRPAMSALSTFYFDLTHEVGSTVIGDFSILESEGYVVGPTSLTLEADAMFAGAFIKLKAVVMGDTTYMTNPLTRNWNRMDSTDSPLYEFDPPGLISDILARIDEASYSAADPLIDGQLQIKGVVPTEAMRSLVGDVLEGDFLQCELRVDPGSFRMTSVRLVGAVSGSEDDQTTRTINLSEFDVPVKIEPPM